MKNQNKSSYLTPSWVLVVLGLTVGLSVTAGVILTSKYSSSELRLQVIRAQTESASPMSSTANGAYQAASSLVADNRFLSVLPLLLTWAAVGLLIYLIAASAGRILGKAVTLRDQFGYVHTSRNSLVKHTLLLLLVRMAAIVGLIVFTKLTIDYLAPYAIAAASIGSLELTLQNAGIIILAVVVWAAIIYIFGVLLRIVALRQRLFGW